MPTVNSTVSYLLPTHLLYVGPAYFIEKFLCPVIPFTDIIHNVWSGCDLAYLVIESLYDSIAVVY